jgi:hypothetical protein
VPTSNLLINRSQRHLPIGSKTEIMAKLSSINSTTKREPFQDLIKQGYLEWKFPCAIQFKRVHRGSKIQTPASRFTRVKDTCLGHLTCPIRPVLRITWFWDLAVHLYGRQWDVHGGWNQPGCSFSWTHSLEQIYPRLHVVNFKGERRVVRLAERL